MNVFAVIDAILVVTIVYAGLTQVVIPLWNGRSVFPAFKKKGIVERELADAAEDVEVAETEKKARQLRKEADKVRGRK